MNAGKWSDLVSVAVRPIGTRGAESATIYFPRAAFIEALPMRVVIIVRPWIDQHAHVGPCVRVCRAFEVLDAVSIQELADIICTNACLVDPDRKVVVVEPLLSKFVPAAVGFDDRSDIRVVRSPIHSLI